MKDKSRIMQELKFSCPAHPTPQMILAFEQFNRGLYWQQHETLEHIWRAETNLELKNFYKGVLQVGVGFHHLTKRNYRGVVKVLTRGINYLKPYAPRCFGVDVERLMSEASAVLERVKASGAERIEEIPLSDLPQVHWE